MGCNCKASQHIRKVKKTFGYESEKKENISRRERFKMGFQAVLIWMLMILGFPFVFLFMIFGRLFMGKKKLKLFNAISIRF